MKKILTSKMLIVPAAAITLFAAGCGGGPKPAAEKPNVQQSQQAAQPDKKEAARDTASIAKFIENAKPVITALAGQKDALSHIASSGDIQPEELMKLTEGIISRLAPAEQQLNAMDSEGQASEVKNLLTQEFATFKELYDLGKKAFSEGNLLDKAKFFMSVKDILGKQDGLLDKISALAKGAGVEDVLGAALQAGKFADMNALISGLGLSGKIEAKSDNMADGSIALLADTTKKFLINDTKNSQAATVDFSPELLNLASGGDGHHVSKFLLNILNDNQDKDASAGTWNGTTHSLPIQAEYDVNNGQVTPGMLKTLNGTNNPSGYTEFLHEQSTVDTVNLLLRGMASLAKSVKQ